MKRVLNGPAALHSTNPLVANMATNHGQVQSRRIRVLLLDKRELFVKVENKNAKVVHIYDEVCASLGLKETDLFGLALLRDSEHFFVHPDTKLQKLAPKMWSQKEGQDEPSLTFLFRVMYYVDNVRLLKYRTTRHLYYLQLKENFLNYNLSISEEKCFLLSAYALITDHGPYDPEIHKDKNYLKPEDYLPSWVIMRRGLDYLGTNLPIMHRDMSTEALSRDARLIFISELSTPPYCHNFHMYKLTRKKYDETDNFSLALGPKGLEIYENCGGFLLRPSISFLWPSFIKFNCDKKKFELICGGSNETKLLCFARSKEWCLHLRSLCKATQKFQRSIDPRLAELRHLEEVDGGWWMEKYIPSDVHDRGGSSSSDGSSSRRHQMANGSIPRLLDANSMESFGRKASSTNDVIHATKDCELNGGSPVYCTARNGTHSAIIGERTDVYLGSVTHEPPNHEEVKLNGNPSECPIKTCNSKDSETGVREINPGREQNAFSSAFNPSSLSEEPIKNTLVNKESLQDLDIEHLNLNDKEILIDTPPNSDSHNLTAVTPLSSNLSPLDKCLDARSSTPKHTSTNVYRHTSYLGTPLSPYLYNPQHQQQQQQSQQQRSHQLQSGSQHHHPMIARHQMSSNAGQHGLLWRASCSGRLMKRHLRSLECQQVHSTEHVPSPNPLHGYFGHCMYKSTPLSVYIPISYHQNGNGILHYSHENVPGHEVLSRESLAENARCRGSRGGDGESNDSLDEEEMLDVDMTARPPPPPYEDAARNSKMRLTASSEFGSMGLEFGSDELVACDGFRSVQPAGSNSDFNWKTGSPNPNLPGQQQPPSILDFQFPLLDSDGMETDFCAAMVGQPAEILQPQSLDFQPSDFISDPQRSHYHRLSLNSYDRWIQQQQHQQLRAFQVQPHKIKAVSPLYAEQVQLSTPLIGRKNLQVFDEMHCSGNSQDLEVPVTKTLRKASSTESEPGEAAIKERNRGKPVQRHHSNITYLRDYKNSEDSTMSFPLVSALLKDPSLQQNVRSFPSNLAALVCDGEQLET